MNRMASLPIMSADASSLQDLWPSLGELQNQLKNSAMHHNIKNRLQITHICIMTQGIL
jgi:hypothetical protein